MDPPGRPSVAAHPAAYLVERYVPASNAESLAESVSRVARICAAVEGAGPPVLYLQSLYLPTEETCFCLFQAPSPDAIRAVNDEGRFALDRITSGVLITASQPDRRKRS
jgi:hypothetical protein